jgi:hypothetical protein
MLAGPKYPPFYIKLTGMTQNGRHFTCRRLADLKCSPFGMKLIGKTRNGHYFASNWLKISEIPAILLATDWLGQNGHHLA